MKQFWSISKLIEGKLLWNWLLMLKLTKILFKIASKLTSIVAILVSITLGGEHIFQVLAQYLQVLPQYLVSICHNTCKHCAGEYTLRLLKLYIHWILQTFCIHCYDDDYICICKNKLLFRILLPGDNWHLLEVIKLEFTTRW